WILDRTSGANTVSVTLSWDSNSGGVGSLPDLRVARWDGAKWANHGNGGTTGNTTTGAIISNALISSFSPFTLGSTSFAANPLPIELNYFKAKKKDQHVELNWQTASEINNNFFTVERSSDAVNFEEIGIVDGAGNSNQVLDYSLLDFNPLKGSAYYRLKQTDFDGAFEYSDLVHAYFTNRHKGKFEVYPNPVTNNFLNVGLMIEDQSNYNISLYNLFGERVISKDIILEEGLNKIGLQISSSVVSGSYLLVITKEGEIVETNTIILN
ncbi:MAG: T9SS type A sorting domain-containing protein, partial [Flavobacteriales bacterium]|nr:T9SS type A sorting domain-containing protein [Flavobacteriales bacterium]